MTRIAIRLPLAAFIALLAMCGGAQGAMVDHVFHATDSAASIQDYSRTASRNEYVILQAWETEKLRALKATNPEVKVLVYKNLAFSAELPASHYGPSPSGVSHSEAPDSWFLKDSHSGQPFVSWGYHWLWAMDIGSRDYQQRWADNVLAEMRAEPWDGVFIDDANATMRYHYTVDRVGKYPSDAAYSAAMGDALAHIGPRIRAAGKLAIPNFAAWVEAPAIYNSWLQHVDGALDEMFVKWGRNHGEGYRGEAQWNAQLNEAKFAAAQGKIFIAYTQGAPGETDAARFGYGTLLLGADENASYAFTPEYASETWLPEYDYDLGAPLGPESSDADGVHRRLFERGLVLVNPTDRPRSVSFGGTYSGSGLKEATSATMAPRTALILVGQAAPPAKGTGKPTGKARIRLYSSVRPKTVRLRWNSKSKSVRRYKVIRNGRPVTTTRRRHEADRRVRAGKVYRYQVVGLDRQGAVVAVSKLLRVQPGGAGQSLAPVHRRVS